MAKRQLSQRELAQMKKEENPGYITVYNRTTNQPVPIQLRAPKGVDFYLGEQTVVLHVGKTAKFPVSRLYREQIINHTKAGRIKILSGTLD